MLLRYWSRFEGKYIRYVSRYNDNIAWCNTFRYLGMTFVAERKLCANSDSIKQHFHHLYVAVNSIVGHSTILMN